MEVNLSCKDVWGGFELLQLFGRLCEVYVYVAAAPEVVCVHREWPPEERARLLVFVPGESTLL